MQSTRRLLTSQTIRPNQKPLSTLFTSTGPVAQSRLQASPNPFSHATNVEFQNPRPGESARQRVERIRDAAYRAKLAQVPWHDKVILRGRKVADNVHRYFVLFLIGSGAILFVFLLYIRWDISRFRRETSRAYLADQSSKRMGFLKVCLEARDAGTATEPQIQFLKRYERVVAEEKKRFESRGVFAKTLDWLAPGVMAKQNESVVLTEMDDELEKAWEERQAQNRKEEAEELERREAQDIQEAHATKGWMAWLGWR